MDPASLTAIGTLIGGVSSVASLLGPKPKAPQAPLPAAAPAPDTDMTPKTSFLSNAAAAATPSQSAGKTLLGA